MPKHQRRVAGLDDQILPLYGKGMSVRDVQRHLEELYQVEVSPALISKVTVTVETDIDSLGGTHGLDPVGGKGMQRRWQQARLFVAEDRVDCAAIAAWPAPPVRRLLTPLPGLPIAFGQRGEAAASPEGIAHITDGSFHASLLVASAHLTGPRREVIVRAEFEQARVEQDLIAAPFEHRAAQIMAKNDAWLARPGLEGVDLAAQKVLHRLIEEELQIQRPRDERRMLSPRIVTISGQSNLEVVFAFLRSPILHPGLNTCPDESRVRVSTLR